MQTEAYRPDRDQRRHQPLPRIRLVICNRPQRCAGTDETERECPDRIDPAGVAAALLHHPGKSHQHRQRHCHHQQSLQVYNRHRWPRKWLIAKVFCKYAGHQARFHPEVPNNVADSALSDLFLSPGCAILLA
jgi:hypothetical protein